MTSVGICYLAAEYYIEHHEWPLSKIQLEEQNQKLLAQAGKLPPEQSKDLSEFLERFSLLELKKKGDNLMLHYRFNADKNTNIVEQTVKLKPKPTVDEIMQSATDGNR